MMALSIKKSKIVGTIDNLQEKLNGDIPVNKIELLELINSWGRNQNLILTNVENKYNIVIPEIKLNECYDLSKFQTVFVKTNTCSRAMLTN